MALVDVSVTVSAGRLASLPESSALHILSRVGGAPGVAVRATRSMGRGLFATKPFSSGDLILIDTAVAWQAGGTRGGAIYSPLPPDDLDLVALQAAPLCWAPADAFPGARVLRSELLDDAMGANAFRIRVRAGCGDDACGLFPVVALVNTSCDANAAAQQIEDSEEGGRDGAGAGAGALPRYEITARRPIAEGEEIMVAYVPRAWPRAKRRAALEETWGVVCACARCARAVDDTAVFRCGSCASGRVFFPVSVAESRGGASGGDACCAKHEGLPRPLEREQLGPSSGGAGVSGVCEDCGAVTVCDVAGAPDASPETLLPSDPSDDATLAVLSSYAAELLEHPFLLPDDARVFAALSRLCSRVSACLESGGEDATALFSRVAQALANAALRSAFTNLHDLGFEIVE